MTTDEITPIPDGQRFFANLIVRGAAQALAFYGRAFGAIESYRIDMGDKIGHAELSIDGVTFMLADEFPELGYLAPAGGGTSVRLVVYVADVDAFAERAVREGATLEHPVRDELYGDRVAMLRDPFGHRWAFQSRRELVSPDELRRRVSASPV